MPPCGPQGKGCVRTRKESHREGTHPLETAAGGTIETKKKAPMSWGLQRGGKPENGLKMSERRSTTTHSTHPLEHGGRVESSQGTGRKRLGGGTDSTNRLGTGEGGVGTRKEETASGTYKLEIIAGGRIRTQR